MARPRKLTDEQLLAAAGGAIAQIGPGFTLSDVASRAGVSAGTFVQRFGSKHGMLVAMTQGAIESVRRDLAPPAAASDDPVVAVRAAIVAWYAPLDDPETAPNNLAQLAFDLGDPELRALMGEFYAAMETKLRTLLRRAVTSGALPGAPSASVAARVLAAMAEGAAIRWSTRPRGSLRRRLRADLDAVLAGWQRDPITRTRGEHP